MKHILTLLLISSTFTLQAQQDPMVEQYCEVLATGRFLSNKVTIDIDYGEERRLWKDHRLKNDEGKLKKFNSVVDAINYLGKDGWKLVNAFPISSGNGLVYHYVFKKEFPLSETQGTE